ncbi:ABC transporter permease [Sphingobacterium daejeonense]|uniref:ABC transporter permease n=1 Tax=Sphingobacterium daejeonense TaxID=371142 RepID=UPI0010C395BB|nr:ABC transporter permease [Sphingobacterium daejeonense]VTP90545.1 Macrolide export ATP-binding/permease protein MacB [Sphingobacterium daejeonense]
MIKNYFKIAFRNLKKNKGFTAINIVGLAIGMAAAMLIMLWVNFQLGFNKNFPKAEQLYVVGSKGEADNKTVVWFSSPKPLAEVLKSDISEAKDVTRLSGTNGYLFDLGNKKVPAGIGAFVDSAFLNMFEFELLAGNRDDALKGPQNIVLTEDLAKNLFGTSDAVGKTIRIDSTNLLNVSAVIKVGEPNHIFKGYEYYMPWTLMEKLGYSDNYWNNSSVDLYVELDKNANLNKIQKQMVDIMPRHSDNETEAFLKPYGDLYLYNKYENGVVTGGRIDMVHIFIVVAVLILLIACINFMNLSTAQSEKRAKEVGIRKVVGAQKKSLIFQFLSESLILAIISGILAVLIVSLTLPSFNDLVGFKFKIPTQEIGFWFLFVGFILLTSFLAGIYPAFFLSSFNPIKVLKGRFHNINQKINPRKVLVVSQFSIAIILIVSTIVIQKQIKHAQDRDFGFEKENLIYVHEVGEIEKNSKLIKQELLEQNIALSVSRMMSPITERWSGWSGIQWEGKDPNEVIQFNRQTGDDRVVETAGFELLAGRDFDLSKFPTDSTAAIINETAAARMKFNDPIGKYFDDGGRKFQIIGVIKDFIQESPFEPVKLLVIEGASGWLNNTHIRFNPNLSTEEALVKAEKVFKKYNPDYPFNYKFVDEAYAKKFAETQKTGKLANLFAGLTIFISCLGLFGLAAFMAESRTKEIGIRKVLGASVFTVTRMLSIEFIVLIVISCFISFPIAYWTMNKFLEDYSYRISINWEIFLFAGVGAILVTLLTVSYQSIKAAMANPVDSLRDE